MMTKPLRKPDASTPLAIQQWVRELFDVDRSSSIAVITTGPLDSDADILLATAVCRTGAADGMRETHPVPGWSVQVVKLPWVVQLYIPEDAEQPIACRGCHRVPVEEI